MRTDYHQLKQIELNGKNISEIEIRHPTAPGFMEDKDIKADIKSKHNMSGDH